MKESSREFSIEIVVTVMLPTLGMTSKSSKDFALFVEGPHKFKTRRPINL